MAHPSTLSNVSRSLFPLVFACLLAQVAPAAANFKVCNQTQHPAAIAIGAFDGKDWATRGWWRVDSGKCSEIIKEALLARYYYLYAVHLDVGGAWDGNRSFCVNSVNFHIVGRQDCVDRGFDRKRFFQVDTGDGPDWTENLSD